ncbi:MAG: hypothetical protein ACRCZF_05855, partial [Gemmataceae bacterium]
MAKANANTSATPATTTTTTEAGGSLLDQILDTTKPVDDSQRERNKQFIDAVIRSALESKP